MKKKHVLVTGGAGFLGAHLCRNLLEAGHEVTCLDNFSTGRRINIKGLLKDNCFRLVEHDVVDPIDINVDEIYNLACPASPIHYQADPIKTIKTSVLGVMNLLELARKYNAKILQASTSEVYGDPIVHPQDERYWGNVNPVGVRSCYDEGKRLAETLIYEYRKAHNVDTKIVRIFNTYGPGLAPGDGRVISNFILQALSSKPITIYGDGRQTRSFCYIDDLIRGIVMMMAADKNVGGPINIGNPKEYSIIELAKTIINMTKSDSQISYQTLPGDDPKLRSPCITLASEALGWSPAVELSSGLERTIEYFKTEKKYLER